MSIRDFRSLIDFPTTAGYVVGMSQPGFQRARSPQAKAQRAGDILAAGARVLDAGGIEAVTLQAIADRAGVAKSNLYRYFESREEILLRLLIDDLEELIAQLEAQSTGPRPVEAVARQFAEGFAARPRLCLLVSQLAPTLERNISGDTLRDVKTTLLGLGQRAAVALAAALPQLAPEQCVAVLNTLFSLVAGLWPMANPGPDLAALLREPQFSAFHKDFAPAFHFAALAVLTGAERLGPATAAGAPADLG